MKMISRRLTPRLSFDKVKGVEEASEDGGVQTKHGHMLINVRKLDAWGILASINVNFQLMEKPLRATLPAMETVGLQK
ncbi:hypothetical protein YC2023_046380 [Brassica napus]